MHGQKDLPGNVNVPRNDLWNVEALSILIYQMPLKAVWHAYLYVIVIIENIQSLYMWQFKEITCDSFFFSLKYVSLKKKLFVNFC